METLQQLLIKNRSYRRFDENYKINIDILKELINYTRLGASARNAQPLKYILSCEADINNKIFPALKWAAYLKDWNGPVEGERPAAFIIMLLDKDISESPLCDHGIAAQNILLGAVEKGLGGCILMSIDKNVIRQVLKISDKYEILMVIALGKPTEQIVIEPMPNTGDYKYWRDNYGIHHVPKRSLEEIIIKEY